MTAVSLTATTWASQMSSSPCHTIKQVQVLLEVFHLTYPHWLSGRDSSMIHI